MRRRFKLALDRLGDIRAAGPNAWRWECWVLPCPTTNPYGDPQLSQQEAQEGLAAHLRAYHGAVGGEPCPGRRARKRAAAAKHQTAPVG